MSLLIRTSLLLLIALTATAAMAAPVDTDNPHGPLTVACSACHTTASWQELKAAPEFDHQKTAFPLLGRHTAVRCRECHTSLVFRDAGTQCRDCHLDIHRGQFANTCSDCHTFDHWSDLGDMYKRHQQTRFPLTGVHADLDCQRCHVSGQFTGLSTECVACHQDDYRNADNPGHVAARFSTDCASCHSITTAAWRNAKFDHAQTGFQLIGAHSLANCSQCHTGGNYSATSSACIGCHAADYQNAQDPNHAAGNFSHECATCHTTVGWQGASFDHNLARFPLTGAHVNAVCSQCHLNNQYTGTTSDCFECHRQAFLDSDNPDHEAGSFNHTCTQCHTTVGWSPAEFDHNLAAFPLTGAHAAVTCIDCHASGQYTGTPQDCWSCHENDYAAVTDPNHAANQFDHNCTGCHATAAWQPATFDHAATAFPLTGAHVAASCAQCHANGQYANTPSECFACHQSDFEGAGEPNHVAQQFSHNCAVCHATAAWEPSSFNHSNTAFPLTGAHVSANCAECHVNGQYAGTPAECYACHREDFEDADDPNHVAGGFSHQCLQCHNTSDWDGGSFNHAGTDFPLTGAHVAVNCAGCHADGVYEGHPSACVACHEDDYTAVTDPNHVTEQFSHVCTQCHTTADFAQATYDHAQSAFPLTGAHTGAACAQCHGAGYNNTPTDCWSCHHAAYNGATNPNHVQNSFPHGCAECHTTAAWEPASFNHNTTAFPLTGAHVPVNCVQCHANGQYEGTPTDCFFCHDVDFNGATDPNHVTGQFPHQCTVCHNTVAWEPSTFNHDGQYFPIYSGEHQGEWDRCGDCHTNPGNYAVFTCLSCHAHNQGDMDDEHDEVSGYSYNSQACFNCHPNGRADGDLRSGGQGTRN